MHALRTALGELELTVPAEPLALSLCFQSPSVPTIQGAAPRSTVPRRRATRSAGQGLPFAPRIPCTTRGKRRDRQCARSGEDSLLCPGMRSAPQARPPPNQLPRGAEAADATLGPGRLPVAERVRVTAGRSEETESSHSRRQQRAFLLQEVAGGEKVRRAGGPRGRGAGKRVLPWRHLAGLPSPRRHCAPGCARAAARPSCGEQRRRWAVAAAGSLAAPLSHPRSETRLRRALRSPARRAAPTSASGAALTPRGSPPPPPSPRPFPPSTDARSRAAAATRVGLM